MLAPRKVLWSTPDAAVRRAFELVPLCEADTVVDIGCGEGRVLLEWAKLVCNDNSDITATSKRSRSITFVGIDTDPERIQAANRAWQEAVKAEQIGGGAGDTSPTDASGSGGGGIKIMACYRQFHCANAITNPSLWKSATVLYLYLTPRGMRQLRPLLDECLQLRYVVSYMNALPDAAALLLLEQNRERVRVPHQPDAAWPLYIYKFR